MSMKNCGDTNENGNRDLPSCSALSQTIVRTRAPMYLIYEIISCC